MAKSKPSRLDFVKIILHCETNTFIKTVEPFTKNQIDIRVGQNIDLLWLFAGLAKLCHLLAFDYRDASHVPSLCAPFGRQLNRGGL